MSARRPSHTDSDLIIGGAGIVGGTLGCILAQQGLRVAIVDRTATEARNAKAGDGMRVLAITPASKQILNAIGAWKYIEQGGIGCFRRIEVWDANGEGSLCFDSADLCEPALGYILGHSIIQSVLERILGTLAGVSWYRPAIPRRVNVSDDQVTVEFEDSRSVTARLLIGADGSDSKIRDLAGIDNALHDYHQHALVCVVKTERPHGNIARQRFLTKGPLAFLPLADPYQSAIVWSTKPEDAAALVALDDEGFCRELKNAFAGRLGDITWSGRRAAFPLGRAYARHYCQPRVALVGDAAHSVHPLAGQGANLGLLDAAALAEILADAMARDRDIGSSRVLRRYERWRKGENLAMMMALDGLNQLFANELGPVQWARNLGLDVVNALAPMKHWFMRRAMGLAGDLPRLARAGR
ncbi:MAG: UbiH/UbiF/VisC/COQ6 family ubiquinone biosynthesis hydroxylase [Gammaproteobacteria bacterium]|nr:UbiH/UbiF/VisC/COQ6 family ubiquinone biosynthesis hydroxylase [Gammaproteobacteria bacterium]